MPLADRLRSLIEGVPEGGAVTLPVGVVRSWLADADEPEEPKPVPPEEERASGSWRERLWTCPPETRLDVEAAAEAIGRPRSALYKLTSAGEIPHRKTAGSLIFVAAELREWVREIEEIIIPGSMARQRLRRLD